MVDFDPSEKGNFDYEFYIFGYDKTGKEVLKEHGKGLSISAMNDVMEAIVKMRRDIVRVKIEIAIERES